MMLAASNAAWCSLSSAMDSSIFMRSRLTSPFPSLLPPAAILAAAAGAPALAADAESLPVRTMAGVLSYARC